MGLDIYVYRLCGQKPKRNFLVISEDFIKKLRENNLGHFIYKKKNHYYDIEKWFKDHKLNKMDYKCTSTYFGTDPITNKSINDTVFGFAGPSEEILYIYSHDCSLLTKVDNVIYTEAVGYQRRGLNSKFYDDSSNGVIDNYVYTLSELERYKQDYCDDFDDKEDFQYNIIDKFIEGKTIVHTSW